MFADLEQGARFEIKGGAAIELRLRNERGVRPRASKDLDATFRGKLNEIQSAVEAALAKGNGAFAFRLEVDDDNPAHMRRFNVAVSYKGKSFTRVKLEISAYEGAHRTPEKVTAPVLTPFGISTQEEWACLPLGKQVAQKIHAVTETSDDRPNERFRDLIDLVLLSAYVPASSDVRELCEETFRVRNKHGWPPSVQAPDHWREPLERVATELGLEHTDSATIVSHVSEYVGAIARS
jgi:hypothetical protein